MFKKKLILFDTRSSLKKTVTRKREVVGFKHAQNIGLIFSIGDLSKHKSIKKFIKILEDDGKTVQVLSYLGKEKENHEFLFDFFTDDDLSIWGKQQNATANKFTNNEFDFLFHLDITRNDLIENILAKSNARCRIGIIQGELENRNLFYELMLHSAPNHSFNDLVVDIFHYAQKVTGNGK